MDQIFLKRSAFGSGWDNLETDGGIWKHLEGEVSIGEYLDITVRI